VLVEQQEPKVLVDK